MLGISIPPEASEEHWEDTSMHSLCDVWSLTHILLGIITSFLADLFHLDPFFFTLFFALLWEVAENFFWGQIIFHSTHPAYKHDNIWNSIFDILFNLSGYFIWSAI